jgi:hypothetical protein
LDEQVPIVAEMVRKGYNVKLDPYTNSVEHNAPANSYNKRALGVQLRNLGKLKLSGIEPQQVDVKYKLDLSDPIRLKYITNANGDMQLADNPEKEKYLNRLRGYLGG